MESKLFMYFKNKSVLKVSCTLISYNWGYYKRRNGIPCSPVNAGIDNDNTPKVVFTKSAMTQLMGSYICQQRFCGSKISLTIG